jgi:hypothetical protein
MWLVLSRQQKGPSDEDEPVAAGWFVLEKGKASVLVKLETGLLFELASVCGLSP